MEITVYDILKQYVNTKENVETLTKWMEIFDKITHPYFTEDIEERINWFNFRYDYDYLRRYRDGSCEKERRVYQALCKKVVYKKEF